jgi:hypothetical protein
VQPNQLPNESPNARQFIMAMAERGVSQLVSVDLEEAERFRDTG